MGDNTIKDTKTEYVASNEIEILRNLIRLFENENQTSHKKNGSQLETKAQTDTLTPKMRAALEYTLKYHQNVYLALKNR